MSKHRVAVLKVVSRELSVTAAAAAYDLDVARTVATARARAEAVDAGRDGSPVEL